MSVYLPHILILIATVILQTTLVPHLKVVSVQPDLILIVTVTYAFLEGAAFGSIIGFSGGLLQDLIVAQNIGLNALCKTIVGYLAGSMERIIFIESIYLPLVAIFIATIVNQTIYAGLAFLFGYKIPFWIVFRNLVLPSALYNSLVAFFVYPMLCKIIAREKVPVFK